MIRCVFIALLLLLAAHGVRAQSYPVQISVQLIPPFSGYLPDYAAPGNDNLRIYITLLDFSQPAYNVKLKFSVSGNNVSIRSKPWYFDGPFTLEPGVPLMLTGSDLAGMLSAAHLDYSGITSAQYNQSKVLPEGFYTLTVTAYDFANPLPIQVSNEATTQAWMMLCDPPLINLPACGSEVPVSGVQFVAFSWTPLNLSSPATASGTEYLFELWEVMPPSSTPGNVVASTAPIYTLTTNLTLLTYGITEPPLQVGWTYVWRIRAYDLEGRALFRNNGYSQICTFTYGNNSELLGNLANLTLSAQVLTHRQARCTWDSTSVYASYHLEFRKVNTPNWFPVNTTSAHARITSLEPLTQYEAQVHGISPSGSDGPWSNIVTFTTPAQAVLNCGEASPPPAQQNFAPLTQATTGMIWQVGQFEMIVTQLTNLSSPNGLYSGLGKMIMPLGITLNVSFTNIQIGIDQVMYAGEVNAVTEGVSAWVTQWNLVQLFEIVDYNYAGDIDSVYILNGMVVILGDSGQVTINAYQPPYTIQDANGTMYTIMPDGSVVVENPIPHIDLSAAQLNVYRMALEDIRSENSPQLIAQYQQDLESKRQALRTTLNTQYGLDYSAPAPAQPHSAVTLTLLSYDSTDVDLQPTQQELDMKQAEYNLLNAEVCRAFARPDPTPFDFDLLANFLYLEGMPSHLYIAQQLATGVSQEDLLQEVKEAIYELIRSTLMQRVFINPEPDEN
jgi:hypothetical protein